MVNILAAPQGSGKTQKMTELANGAVSMYNGNVVFIKKDHRNTKDFSFDLRVVCMDDYPTVRDEDELVAFILGMSAADMDIEAVFIDGIYQLIKVDVDRIIFGIIIAYRRSCKIVFIKYNMNGKHISFTHP